MSETILKEYTTIQNDEVVFENVIEKSRFVASAKHVENAREAMEFVGAERKRYFDATHNCYAYIAGETAKFSDDGEPQGTAGMPIFDCIRNSRLNFLCVVVTRYFGGKKLGAGGLVRAYGGSCAEVLKKCEKLKMTDCTRFEVSVDYSSLKPLRLALQGIAREDSVVFDTTVRIVFSIPTVLYSTILDIVSESTLGKGKISVLERLLCNFSN